MFFFSHSSELSDWFITYTLWSFTSLTSAIGSGAKKERSKIVNKVIPGASFDVDSGRVSTCISKTADASSAGQVSFVFSWMWIFQPNRLLCSTAIFCYRGLRHFGATKAGETIPAERKKSVTQWSLSWLQDAVYATSRFIYLRVAVTAVIAIRRQTYTPWM